MSAGHLLIPQTGILFFKKERFHDLSPGGMSDLEGKLYRRIDLFSDLFLGWKPITQYIFEFQKSCILASVKRDLFCNL